MTDAYTNAFDSMYDTMPTARAQLRYGADTIAEALSSGVARQKAETDVGLYEQFVGSIRFKDADLPSAWPQGDAITGKVIQILFAGQTDWVEARVVARHPSAGIVRLDVAAEYGTM